MHPVAFIAIYKSKADHQFKGSNFFCSLGNYHAEVKESDFHLLTFIEWHEPSEST